MNLLPEHLHGWATDNSNRLSTKSGVKYVPFVTVHSNYPRIVEMLQVGAKPSKSSNQSNCLLSKLSDVLFGIVSCVWTK